VPEADGEQRFLAIAGILRDPDAAYESIGDYA
jgi:hypothetical protein